MLPKIVDNSYEFGYMHETFLGSPIKINAIISDQSASMIANCCFKQWSSKITLGTGAFLQINVGQKPRGHSQAHPLVAWKVKNSQGKSLKVYKLEFFHNNSVDAIKYIKTLGLCDNDKEMSKIAMDAGHSDGVSLLFFKP